LIHDRDKLKQKWEGLMLYQRTLNKKATVTGIGLHSGKKVTLTLHPAPSDHGIIFKRTDLKDSVPLKTTTDNVGTTENATTLGQGLNSIHTVEHLLAVLYGLGIDNVYCEVDGPEIPIMDGSGSSFVYLIKEAGIINLAQRKKFIVITKTVRVEQGDKWVEISPSPQLVIDSTIVFAHPQIRKQREVFEFSCESFIREVSRARTFGLLRDVDHLKKKGLVKGGSLDNAIVLDDFRVMNAEGLRYKNEFVRHKILDTIGDIRLLGHEVAGKVTTYKSGHNLHNQLCKQLLSDPSAYEIISAAHISSELKEALEHSLSLSFT
jgi:UDP-3-O-[3-hydroxymyristoyl] N-acetylglucosamine deacetylase